jgi:hypothetical protein
MEVNTFSATRFPSAAPAAAATAATAKPSSAAAHAAAALEAAATARAEILRALRADVARLRLAIKGITRFSRQALAGPRAR